jgi:hypothetical protein
MPEHSFSTSNYGFLSRLLHKLALDYSSVAETLFDIEQTAARRTPPRTISKPIFIVGLARSGTTAVLTSIYETGEFRSLTYKDMPFVLMPSVWKKLSGSKSINSEKVERAHGDGILVNAESPEAFEEIFWRTFCHSSYIHDECLTPHKIDKKTLDKFRLFVSSAVNTADDPRQSRYLSKNNNNLLRLPTIRKAFPDAVIIVPFRDPVQQSISLMNQHRRFCQLHKKDPFSLKYMDWLAHHEFGLGHKPFVFDDASEDPRTYHPGEANYWLSIWNSSYQHVLKTADMDSYFLCFERLCEQTAEEISRLYARADIPFDENYEQSTFALPPTKTLGGGDPNLIAACNQTYQEMVQRNNPGPRQD